MCFHSQNFVFYLVQKWITQTAQKFVTQSQELVVPGISDYLRSSSGNQFLQNTSKDNTCFIKLDSPDNPEWLEAQAVKLIVIHLKLCYKFCSLHFGKCLWIRVYLIDNNLTANQIKFPTIRVHRVDQQLSYISNMEKELYLPITISYPHNTVFHNC